MKEFPLHKPQVDATHRSDLYVVFTEDGQTDIAVYDERTDLWYSLVDPTGFSVKWFTSFEYPEGFDFGDDLSDLLNGEGDYEVSSSS